MGTGATKSRSLQRKHAPERRSGYSVPTTLRGIADKAKKSRKHKFQDLYRFLDHDYLRECFYELKKNAAPGVDRVDFYEYQENLEANLAALVVRLRKGRYRAKLVRRKVILKPNGKPRPLGILCTEEKIVQAGATRILTAIYEADFLECSYGYRPKRGALGAVRELTQALQFGPFGWIVEADIQGFFDNIDHDWLMRMLAQRIADRKFLQLIRKWLKAGVLDTTGLVTNPATGTPQGGIISPILANVYLHYTLDLWFDKIVRRSCKGRAKIVRYADDFVCAFQYRHEAEDFYEELGKRLLKFKLALAPKKTRLLRFSRFQVGRGYFEFLGFEFRWGKNRKGNPQVWRTTAKNKLKTAIANFTDWIKRARSLGNLRIFKTLKLKYQGYWNYYGVIGNIKRLEEFYYITTGILFKWLNRRSQRRSYDWDAFNKALVWYRIPGPRIMEKSAA
jgi:RNA-directed DNA polymerase